MAIARRARNWAGVPGGTVRLPSNPSLRSTKNRELAIADLADYIDTLYSKSPLFGFNGGLVSPFTEGLAVIGRQTEGRARRAA